MSRSRMLELLEPRQLLSADVLESSLVVDQPVLSMPALSVDAGKLERFAADDMLLIRTDGEDEAPWGEGLSGNEEPKKDVIYEEHGRFRLSILDILKLDHVWKKIKYEKVATTQPTTQPSDQEPRWRTNSE